MQLGETIAKFFGFDDEPTEGKEPLKIRFSLFFDGTLNNRTNIEAREKNEIGKESASYKEYGDGGQNSYDNGRTNIALLEPHAPYKEDQRGETGYDFVFKVYIEGQGTFDEKGDSGLGYSMGAGESGVDSRARQGIERAFILLTEYLREKPPEKFFVEKIDVDVFGFSRGAATARQCIFLISDQSWRESIPLSTRVNVLGYREVKAAHVEVCFAGVYDTVVSVKASQYNWWADGKLNQRAIAIATKSVHLAAAEEHRQDFPLHTIKSAKDCGRGKEYYLPGVHSDVGGSYNLANELTQDDKFDGGVVRITIAEGSYKKMMSQRDELIKMGAFTAAQLEVEVTDKGIRRVPGGLTSAIVPTDGKLVELRRLHGPELMRVSSDVNRVINFGYLANLVEDRDRLVAQGWYKDKEEIEIQVKLMDQYGRVGGNLVVNRKDIKSAYSNIPLKLMAGFARENGIQLDSKLETRADLVLGEHADLKALESKIKRYIASVGNASKPEDWIEDLSADLKRIRHDHLHMSAKVGIGYMPRMRRNRRVRYYYDG